MSRHPAGCTGPLWFGVEVEGPRVGTFTAFVTDALNARDLHVLRVSGVEHVFLTESFEAWGWFAVDLLPAIGDVPVTVARDVRTVHDEAKLLALLSSEVAARLSVVVRVVAPWLARLRPSDMVSLGVPYSLTTWRVSDGVVTQPHQYLDDATAPEGNG